jgi:predicted phage terminase large subunit-like protein
VLIDDPHSTTTAESDVQRTDTVKKFREGATDRLNDIARSATIVIMQRLHMKDVAGTILDLIKGEAALEQAAVADNDDEATPLDQAETLDGWVTLILPMEFEPDRKCVTVLRPANDGNPALLFEDPRTRKGELLFPERFPPKQLARLKRFKGSYAWAGQYQQRPAPREGGMFARQNFVLVRAVPNAIRQRLRKWDLAATETDGSNDPDWTVGLLMAEDELGFWYIEDVVRLRATAALVERMIVNTALLDRTRYGSVPIHLSQDPGQAGKAQVGYLTRALAGHVVTSTLETGSKVTRAEPLSAQVEAGNVRVVVADWNEDFFEEAEVFPNGAHDDQIDAASGAFNQMTDTSAHRFAFA